MITHEDELYSVIGDGQVVRYTTEEATVEWDDGSRHTLHYSSKTRKWEFPQDFALSSSFHSYVSYPDYNIE